MAILNRDQVRAAQDRKPIPVQIPEWGGEVPVRGLSGTGKSDFEVWATQIKTDSEGRLIYKADKSGMETEAPTLDRLKLSKYKLITLTAENEDGTPMFEESDMGWLAEKSGAATEKLFDVAAALSGLSSADVNKLAGVVTDLPNSQSAKPSSDEA
jgi:type II secretory pathway component PulK